MTAGDRASAQATIHFQFAANRCLLFGLQAEIVAILERIQPASVREVVDLLKPARAFTTVATVLGRILGALGSHWWIRKRRQSSADATLQAWTYAGTRGFAALPYFALAIALAALLPAKPWIWLSGLCACEAHGGVHLCPLHPQQAFLLIVPLGLLAARSLFAMFLRITATLIRLRDIRYLAAEAVEGANRLMMIDNGGHPLAFVVGLARPRLFVDGSWWQRLSERDRRAIEAHERTHIDARDPLVLAWLDLTLAVFAPRVRADVVRCWTLLAEMRADKQAALQDGDPAFVAALLCRYARGAMPEGAMGLQGPDLALRVEWLLGEAPAGHRRHDSAWGWVGMTMAAVAGGHGFHRLFEVLVRLL